MKAFNLKGVERRDKMQNVRICLNSFDKIKNFINIADRLDCQFKLVSGSYVIDGKSVLGLFCLDLSKPIEVNIINDSHNLNPYPKEFEKFIV